MRAFSAGAVGKAAVAHAGAAEWVVGMAMGPGECVDAAEAAGRG